jgi:hypothetical protein
MKSCCTCKSPQADEYASFEEYSELSVPAKDASASEDEHRFQPSAVKKAKTDHTKIV